MQRIYFENQRRSTSLRQCSIETEFSLFLTTVIFEEINISNSDGTFFDLFELEVRYPDPLNKIVIGPKTKI